MELRHPPYSPSDYYLFRSLQNLLEGKTFTSNEGVKNALDRFDSKDQNFVEHGIANARKMAKGIGPKWGIYNLIKYLYTKKNRLSSSPKKMK